MTLERLWEHFSTELMISGFFLLIAVIIITVFYTIQVCIKKYKNRKEK